MKKLLSLTLALIMVLSLSVAVFADTTYQDVTSVSIGVRFDAPNGIAGTPQETFNYTISKGAAIGAEGAKVYVEESSLANIPDSVPLPTESVYSVSLTPGSKGLFTISLPTYTSVGIYYYTVTQTPGNTAGVEYDDSQMIVKVTVIQQGKDKVRVAFATANLADKDGNLVTDAKTATFVNTYSAGSLSVKKLVEGNLGARDKEFTVNVEFTAPVDALGNYDVVNSTISYYEDADEITISPVWNGNKASVQIQLHHEETVTFTNIPYGVTYNVTEEDYTSEGYVAGVITYDDPNKKIDADTPNDTVTVTNTKNSAVDTGIVLDSLPYVLLIAVAVVGVVIFTSRKRSRREY